MSDHQAIYDAVRSRISGGDIGHVAREVMEQTFDFSHQKAVLQEQMLSAVWAVEAALKAPSAVYRPAISIDGNKWCALYGDNLQDGVAGFGDSPAEAMADFDKAWGAKLLPADGAGNGTASNSGASQTPGSAP